MKDLLKNKEKIGSKQAILVLPGGGYMLHSVRDQMPVIKRFSSLGIDTYVHLYKVGVRVDFKELLQRLSEVIEELKKDHEKIYLLGFSAGGHLAALYTSLKYSPSVSGQILAYPVVNWKAMHEHNKKAEIVDYGVLADYDENYDPINLIHPSIPRTFMWFTRTDEVVLSSHNLEYAKKLVENNIDIQLHMFNRGEHALSTCDEISCFAMNYPKEVGIWCDLCASWIREE